MDRRSALVAMGIAGLGLIGLHRIPALAGDSMTDTLSDLVPRWSDKSREKVRALLTGKEFSGRIAASEAMSLAANEQITADELMVQLLPVARRYARPPISDYHVGAVASGAAGDLYLGANIELPGQSLGLAVHGEQFALSNAYMHSERGIASIAVTAAPCGHCRQFMNEFSPGGTIKVLIAGNAPSKLSALLPMAFGPRDLGFAEGAVPVKVVRLARPEGVPDAVTLAAWEAAAMSYAPYTKAHSGVAIATRAGRIYRGSYIENVAFNPSLSPLQTALAALIVAGEDYAAIKDVVLVEVENAVISQRSVAEAALAAIAPGLNLRRVTTRVA